jgi:hypothetical protein
MNIRRIGFVTGEHAVAIEIKMIGIGTHETHRISRSRQLLDPTLLQSGKIGWPDAKRLADTVEVETELLAPRAQQLADRARAGPRLDLVLLLRGFAEGRLYALE